MNRNTDKLNLSTNMSQMLVKLIIGFLVQPKNQGNSALLKQGNGKEILLLPAVTKSIVKKTKMCFQLGCFH